MCSPFCWVLLCFVALMFLGLVVWPDASCQNFLNNFASDRLGTSSYMYRLFTNNHTPGTGSLFANFTEATFTGYGAVSGATIVWPAASLAGHVAQSTGTNIVFNNTSGAPVNIYGVYVTDAANAKLYFAERDTNAPVSIPAGGSYVYTPNQQFQSIN
jgi:hypothetical protein